MGVWHIRCVNITVGCIEFNMDGISADVSKEISFSSYEKLGLLSSPNSSAFLYADKDLQKNDIAVVIDGHIYNQEELLDDLGLKKESEIGNIVIMLYRTYGYEGLYRLDGVFSLILYDEQKKLTLLYHSFLNGYPLYYVNKNNFLTVSTNPTHLMYRKDISCDLDMTQMSAYFSLDFSTLTDTIFLDLNEVEDGEIVIITPNKIESKKRSLNKIFTPIEYGSESEIIKKYRHILTNTLKKNISLEYQYGIMLSSGIDSSFLAVLASQHLKSLGSKLRAYSWSLPNSRSDETQKIKELCHSLDIELTIFDGSKFGPFDTLDNLVLQPDTPFSNMYWPLIEKIYRRMSEDGVNVVINGNYGDILFPSTQNLFTDILRDKRYELFIPAMKSVIGHAGFHQAIKKSSALRGLLKHFLPVLNLYKRSLSPPEWLSSEMKIIKKEMWKNNKIDIEKGYEHFSLALSKKQTSYSGMTRYLNSKYGIEKFEPYRDVHLLNYTLNLPSYMTYRDGQTKYFAREAMRGLLPESIRTQARVGDLSAFACDSFMKNSKEVQKRIFDDTSSWKVYVDEQWMQEKFEDLSQIQGSDLLIIWLSLNIGPWQKAIKPGGSLYERKI